MTTDLWTYREEVWLIRPLDTGRLTGMSDVTDTDTVDLSGFKVHARDGSIGHIDRATNDAGRGFVVVDTGPWIFGRKVMIPAGTLERVDHTEREVFVNLTKDQIKDSPEFDPDTMTEDDEYRDRLGEYYTRSGWTRAA